MIFLDINTFYSPKAGGIRTYHRAKLDYFKKHQEHRYILVCPGPCRKSTKPAPNISIEEIHGVPVTKDPEGYRIMLNYFPALSLIRKIKPDIVEAGDPWLTWMFSLFSPFPSSVKKAFFYHSDPVDTYLIPWSEKPGIFRPVKKVLVKIYEKLFFLLHRRFFTTIVTSEVMQRKLVQKKVPRIACLPLGINRVFIKQGEMRKADLSQAGQVKLLYAGRLDPDKGIELLISILPQLLENENISLAVAGRGKYASFFREFPGPRFSYLGFTDSYEQLAQIYLEHDIFLATGEHETFGLGVLEAMACGLVVVGPDQGGSAEVLKRANSNYMFESGDSENFYKKVMEAAYGDYKKEIPVSIKTAGEYGDWDMAIRRMVDYYLSLTEEGSKT
jgi:alpha-1,6-mannosyltransferase